MYYFTLCDFFYNYKVINYFITLLDQYPNYFINSDICFNAYEGSYSYFYFNGEFNNNNGPITLSQDLKNKNNIKVSLYILLQDVEADIFQEIYGNDFYALFFGE